MKNNPDVYLLYEYMEKIPFAIRIKVRLDEEIDAAMLTETAQSVFRRFTYYNLQVGIDDKENYTLEPNSRPIAVLPEENRRMTLGSDETNGHLFVITYRNDEIWFTCSHSVCGGHGILYWVKASLYAYLCKKYGPMEAPKDIKLPDMPVTEEETFYPDVDKLPTDEPLVRYEEEHCNIALGRILKFLLNPFAQNNYYYEIEIPSKQFMEYAAKIDGSPNSIITAMMYKAVAHYFKEKPGTFISGRIAADYRKDIGADKSYRDFVRLILVKYEWSMKDDPIDKLNMRARGALITQNQPELSCERIRKLQNAHNLIDEQPTLKLKKKAAAQNSAFRSDPRCAYTVSYVGQMDLGGMSKHVKSYYTITDGDLMLEINALDDKFCICFQLIDKDRAPLDRFLEILGGENIPYTVSGIKTRYLPKIKLPKGK